MAYRDRSANETSGNFNFCIMEVRLRKKNAAPDAKEDAKIMMVDSHWETLRFVQDHMEECVGNIVRLKRLELKDQQRMVDSSSLFEKNLEPLLSTLAQTKGPGVMDTLSASLKKALLLMVMTRYHSDTEKASQVLGISREKLEKELKLCGMGR